MLPARHDDDDDYTDEMSIQMPHVLFFLHLEVIFKMVCRINFFENSFCIGKGKFHWSTKG